VGTVYFARRFLYGAGVDEVLASVDSGASRSYYFADAQGSVIALANASGQVAEKYAYLAYGPGPAAGTAAYRYTGRRYEPETGLYFYRARAYSPTFGRFLQTDPIGTQGGINLYAYVGNDPLNLIDPYGLAALFASQCGSYCSGRAESVYPLETAILGWGAGRIVGGLASAAYSTVTGYFGGTGAAAAIEGSVAASSAIPAAAVTEDAGLGLSAAESWGNPATLARHFADHGADFAATSAEDYASQASQFFERSQAAGLPTKIDIGGTIRIYDPASNTFGAYNANGTIRTFFKPTSPTYFNRQPGVFPPILGAP